MGLKWTQNGPELGLQKFGHKLVLDKKLSEK